MLFGKRYILKASFSLFFKKRKEILIFIYFFFFYLYFRPHVHGSGHSNIQNTPLHLNEIVTSFQNNVSTIHCLTQLTEHAQYLFR
jgi:hypothetical protein